MCGAPRRRAVWETDSQIDYVFARPGIDFAYVRSRSRSAISRNVDVKIRAKYDDAIFHFEMLF